MLKDLSLKTVYDTSKDDLIKDLFIPALSNSKSYKRGVGYFTSNWIKLVIEGIDEFVKNNGRIKLVTSPNLEKKDWEYINKGIDAKQNEYIYKILNQNIEKISQGSSNYIMNYFAWLIADDILEIIFAIPKNNIGEFHDKFAIFYDGKEKVVIHGSYNDSYKGTLNGESYSVFKSWIPGHYEFINLHEKKFDEIINNNNSFYKIYDMPKAIKNKVVKLRKRERPYIMDDKKYKRGKKIPDKYELYPYQEKAIRKWIKNKYCGIFEMATGTGKTITSLSASIKFMKYKRRFILVILVPYKHLVEQWEIDIINFGYNPVKCSSDYKTWHIKLKRKLRNYRDEYLDDLCVLATHSTASRNKFIKLFNNLNEDILLIADEMHNLGAPNLHKALLDKYNYRIGLSATPRRWFDKKGNKIIFDYFKKSVFKYSLKEAINNDFLVNYEFLPRNYSVDLDFIYEYKKLTNKISKLFYKKTKSKREKNILKSLIRKRSNLVKINKFKTLAFKNDFKNYINLNKNNLEGILVYCGPGETNEIIKYISDLGIRVHEFNSQVTNKERQKLLKNFKNNDIQVLVAIKCLDEGVNIPSVKTAFFITSTSNPKEFIQRRGRVLRKYNDKKITKIFDYYIVPNINLDNKLDQEELEIYIKILEKELPRFAEFSDSAINKYKARKNILPYLELLNISHLLDKKPWDVFLEKYDR